MAFNHHGLFNLHGLIIFTIISFIIINIIFASFYLIFNQKYILLSIIFVALFLSFHKLKLKYGKQIKCEYWDYGINKTKINNISCKIKKPKICLLNFVHYFSFYRIYNNFIDCKNRKKMEKSSLKGHNKYVTFNTKRIGFPVTTNNPNFKEELLLSNEAVYKIVLENLIDMDNKEQLKSIEDHLWPEVIINYNNNPYGKVEINL